MRVISQNGMIDIPYELTAIHTERETVLMNMVGNTGRGSVLATYSTESKAIKAMEMLRDKYMRWKCFSVLANGTCEHMENSFSSEEFPNKVAEFCKMNVFQFPKDEEIEVEE